MGTIKMTGQDSPEEQPIISNEEMGPQGFDPDAVYQELQALRQHFQTETSRLIDYLNVVRPNVQDGLWDLTYLRDAFSSYFDHEMWRCFAPNPLEQPPWAGYMHYTSANLFQEYSRVLHDLQQQGLIQLVPQALPNVLIPQLPAQPGQAITSAQMQGVHLPTTQPFSDGGAPSSTTHHGMT